MPSIPELIFSVIEQEPGQPFRARQLRTKTYQQSLTNNAISTKLPATFPTKTLTQSLTRAKPYLLLPQSRE
jgi:hypothetical protein